MLVKTSALPEHTQQLPEALVIVVSDKAYATLGVFRLSIAHLRLPLVNFNM